ncbi:MULTISPECIES: YaiI/YqxD family protein [unclassified Enterococcus]|uniref:YaiI/YqxD family protein n=1 Tax=unclassified Enterococcus TaxID=2608891 RepID=UPI000A359375|nr:MULTISPECIES: YaiI/YqxD family protein [unclassified Enterococcus]
MRIFIDGDGSPVKDTTIDVALKHSLDVVIVTSIDHYSLKEYPKNVSFVYVDKGADAADYKIVQLIDKGDILVTQDYGLASLVLPKGVRVLHQLGYEYTGENMDSLLEQRYFSAKVRKSGGRTKGPKAFTQDDREKFRAKLVTLITE